MKSVLLHIDGTAEQEARFQLAADVVRAMEGHLTCLQPVASMETYLPTDPFGISAFAGDALERARAWEKEQQDAIETRLRTENISWDWHAHPGAPAQLIADHSWLSELVVVSAPQQDWPGRLAVPPIAADVVMRARTGDGGAGTDPSVRLHGHGSGCLERFGGSVPGAAWGSAAAVTGGRGAGCDHPG
jgi:hypothetical protein